MAQQHSMREEKNALLICMYKRRDLLKYKSDVKCVCQNRFITPMLADQIVKSTCNSSKTMLHNNYALYYLLYNVHQLINYLISL